MPTCSSVERQTTSSNQPVAQREIPQVGVQVGDSQLGEGGRLWRQGEDREPVDRRQQPFGDVAMVEHRTGVENPARRSRGRTATGTRPLARRSRTPVPAGAAHPRRRRRATARCQAARRSRSGGWRRRQACAGAEGESAEPRRARGGVTAGQQPLGHPRRGSTRSSRRTAYGASAASIACTSSPGSAGSSPAGRDRAPAPGPGSRPAPRRGRCRSRAAAAARRRRGQTAGSGRAACVPRAGRRGGRRRRRSAAGPPASAAPRRGCAGPRSPSAAVRTTSIRPRRASAAFRRRASALAGSGSTASTRPDGSTSSAISSVASPDAGARCRRRSSPGAAET